MVELDVNEYRAMYDASRGFASEAIRMIDAETFLALVAGSIVRPN